MLSATQAQTISERIISLTRQARVEDWNSRASPVPLLYRCPELMALPPWQRQQVLAFALQSVSSRWPVIITLVAWLAAFLALVFFALGPASGGAPVAIMIFLLIGGPPLWVRAVLARREIKEAARELMESRPIEG